MSIIHNGSKVRQEFYCRHCPADDPTSKDPAKTKTGGHFRVLFHMGYDANLKIKCPKCGHVHERGVQNGEIFDGRNTTTSFTEEIRVPLSAWSRDPVTQVAAAAKAASPKDNFLRPIRGGLVIKGEGDLTEEARNRRLIPALQLYDPAADAPASEPAPPPS